MGAYDQSCVAMHRGEGDKYPRGGGGGGYSNFFFMQGT